MAIDKLTSNIGYEFYRGVAVDIRGRLHNYTGAMATQLEQFLSAMDATGNITYRDDLAQLQAIPANSLLDMYFNESPVSDQVKEQLQALIVDFQEYLASSYFADNRILLRLRDSSIYIFYELGYLHKDKMVVVVGDQTVNLQASAAHSGFQSNPQSSQLDEIIVAGCQLLNLDDYTLFSLPIIADDVGNMIEVEIY